MTAELYTECNQLLLSGAVGQDPCISHVCCGALMIALPLAVCRKSGVCDVLPVLARADVLPPSLVAGDRILLKGQLRAYGVPRAPDEPFTNRVRIHAFARMVLRTDAPDENAVMLTGRIHRPPSVRTTPLGREICDLSLAVERSFGRVDRLPVIAWGGNAHLAGAWRVGDVVAVTGRLQSRGYTKVLPDGAALDMVAYEVSAASVHRVSEG